MLFEEMRPCSAHAEFHKSVAKLARPAE